MAEKRMFSKKIVDSDAFLDLPLSAQALYFHLGMRADDDGALGNAKRVCSYIGASAKDFQLLIKNRFLLEVDDVIFVKHWKINNYIASDRYHPTAYQEEYKKLSIKDNKSYTERIHGCVHNDVSKVSEQVCTDGCSDKNREDKNRKEENRSVPVYPNFEFDVEKAWSDTFSLYPKKTSSALAKQYWMETLTTVIPGNRKEVALLIASATRMYLADYKRSNPEDEKFRYVPKYSEWLKNDCDYWIKEYEKQKAGDSS